MRTKTTRLRAAVAMLLALALSLGVAACGSSSNDSSSTEAEESNGAGAIVSNPENGKVSLTIGSKNFPEQEILGEIYTQALAAAGYKVKSDLNLGSETVAHKAVKSGAGLRLPGVREHGADLVLRPRTRRSPVRRKRSVRKGKRRIRKGRPRPPSHRLRSQAPTPSAH